MKSLRGWFNIYFVLALAALASGCHTGTTGFGHKQVATIRIYLQTRQQSSSGGRVFVTRERIPMTVESAPILDESDLTQARLVDDADGTYAIELAFDDHGAAVLDMTSVANRGRCLVIFSHFPPPGTQEGSNAADATEAEAGTPDKPRRAGWISAVMINGRLTGGTLRFTPDATHDEAARIVTGLQNVIKKARRS